MHKVKVGRSFECARKMKGKPALLKGTFVARVTVMGNRLVNGHLVNNEEIGRHIERVAVERFDGKTIYNDQDDEKDSISNPKVVYIQRGDPTVEMLAHEIYRNLSEHINGMQYTVEVENSFCLSGNGFCDGTELKPIT